jgi:hypothetical protein
MFLRTEFRLMRHFVEVEQREREKKSAFCPADTSKNEGDQLFNGNEIITYWKRRKNQTMPHDFYGVMTFFCAAEQGSCDASCHHDRPQRLHNSDQLKLVCCRALCYYGSHESYRCYPDSQHYFPL